MTMKLYNARQAAEYVGCTVRNIQTQAQKGVLEFVHDEPYMFLKEQLDNYIKEHKGNFGPKPK